MNYFVNITNHVLTEDQLCAIPAHTEIVSLGSPAIPAHWSVGEVEALASQWVDKLACYAWPAGNHVTVHIMGEQAFVYAYVDEVRRLYGERVVCVCSTTERVSVETTATKFVRFRAYF